VERRLYPYNKTHRVRYGTAIAGARRAVSLSRSSRSGAEGDVRDVRARRAKSLVIRNPRRTVVGRLCSRGCESDNTLCYNALELPNRGNFARG